MHYCVQLLTKHLPTEKEIERIMRPYSCDVVYGKDDEDSNIEHPAFTYDYYLIGGRYKARIKMKSDADDKENND